MLRSRILGGLAVACLTLAAGAASAQATAPAAAPAAASVSKADFVARRMAPLVALDADRDGSVTVAERQAARQTRIQAAAQRRFDRLDADRNGAISREEFQAPGAARRAEGVRAEGPRHARRAALQRHRGDAGRRGAMMRPGRAGPALRAASRPVAIADARTRIEAAFDRLDADKDGVLTAAERQSARPALREARPGRREAMRMRRQSAPATSPSTPASE